MKTLVLIYHNVVESNNDLHLYDVSLDDFRKQIVLLKSPSHHITTSPSHKDTQSHVLFTTPYTQHPTPLSIVLTFDDGYKSWANNVLDILNEAGLKAYFFICIEFIKNGSISEEDIVKLKDNGMIIGSHGMKHRFLHRLSTRELFYELGESKKLLEGIIHDRIKYFSVPRGMHNRHVLRIAKDLGYERIFTSEIGINKNDDFVLKRIPIKRNTSLDDFKNIIDGVNINKLSFQQKIKDRAKRMLGIGLYNALRRSLIFKVE